MVLMKLFERQQWRHRHREQTHGHEARGIGEKERVGWMERITWKLSLLYVNR